MAEEKEELDLDTSKSGGGKKKLIIIIVLAVVLIGAGVGAALMFLGGGEEAEEGAEKAVEAPKKAIYMPLKKMTVNLPKGPARFLQVEMQLMSYNQAALDAVNEYMPVIRNDILLQLASQKYEEISTLQGKEQLRTQLLETVQGILKEQAGMEQSIDSIYFTSFVMQ